MLNASCLFDPLDRPPSSPVPDANRRGWHKTSTSFLKSALTGHDSLSLGGDSTVSGVSRGGTIDSVGGGGTLTRISDPETDSHIEGILSTEASMVVLDTLELIVQVRFLFISSKLTFRVCDRNSFRHN